eukprot:SAG31_NODE_167_length_21485_cov_31.094922_14_plen_156_part_00
MGRFVSEAYLDAAMALMDEDGSGQVEYSEFEGWWDEQMAAQEATVRENQPANPYVAAANEPALVAQVDYAFQPAIDVDSNLGHDIFERAKKLRAAGQWLPAVIAFEQYRLQLRSVAAAETAPTTVVVSGPPRPQAQIFGLLNHQVSGAKWPVYAQ